MLDLRQASDWNLHPFKGAIFETFVVSGVFKLFSHSGETPPLYFWRDQTGHEIDLVEGLLCYAGEENYEREKFIVQPWWRF